MQVLHARHRHVHQEVVAAGQHEHRQHLGQAGRVRLETLDHRPVQRADLHVQQRLDVAAEGGEADLRVIPGDHSTVTQQTHPLQTGRRGDADGAGQVAVGLPGVRLQFPHDRRINVIHGRDSA
ncbi:hypothetical protein GCM10025331_54820 [Actinoplanes utahensis]|nr:hypothetical protein Aut01nite_62170 [Actinoplanes utahensis]